MSGIRAMHHDTPEAEALTTYGILGVKVWIFKGEVLVQSNSTTENLSKNSPVRNKKVSNNVTA